MVLVLKVWRIWFVEAGVASLVRSVDGHALHPTTIGSLIQDE